MAGDCRVSKLKGADIKSNNGENLGKLQDLMVHMWIPALVLGLGGTAGLIRTMRANCSSLVVTAPASPQAPRFLPG